MVLRSESVGEQDVADQRGAFSCAEGGRPRAGRPPFALGGARRPRADRPPAPPSCVQDVEAPRAPCGRRGGSVY